MGWRKPEEGTAYDAARHVVLELARSLDRPTDLPVAPRRRKTSEVTEPSHLSLAVLAEQVVGAAERLTRESVARAREVDGVTWEEVGRAFGITRQAAHERFSRSSDQPKAVRRPRRRLDQPSSAATGPGDREAAAPSSRTATTSS